VNRKIINSIASHNKIRQRSNINEKTNSMIMNNVVKRNFMTKHDAVRFLKNVANHSPLGQQRYWKINGALANENMIERLMRTTTKDPKKKHSGDQGIEYSEYYNDNSAEPIKTQSKGDETMFENDRIIRQIANNSTLNDFNNQLDDHLQFKKSFTDSDNSYDKDLIYNDDSLKPWETNHSVIAQSDSVIDYAFTRLPALIDQKLHLNNPHYIRSNRGKLIFHQIPNIERAKGNTFNKLEFLTEDSAISNFGVTQIFTTSEKAIFDSQIEVKQIPETLQYQTELNLPHLYSNLSVGSKINKLEETGGETELYYLDTKDAVESSMNAPHIFRKVPGTLNLYIANEKNADPVVSAISNEYVYPVIFTEQPLHKINEAIFSQSVMSNQPVEHILIPDRQKNIEQDQHENDQTQLMIEKDQKMIENLSGKYKNDDDKMCDKHSFETIMKDEDMKSQHANISITLNETQEVANQILGKIIDELEEIKSSQAIENEQIEGYYIKNLRIYIKQIVIIFLILYAKRKILQRKF